jgi:hypothetical protein
VSPINQLHFIGRAAGRGIPVLYLNLFFACILLAGVTIAYRPNGWAILISIVMGVVCSIATFRFAGALYIVWELSVILPVIALVAVCYRRKPLFFFSWTLAATVAVFGINCAVAWIPTWIDIEQLRDQFPYESLEGRLPQRPISDNVRFPAYRRDRWDRIESSAGFTESYGGAYDLHDLHENMVQEFINRPNFGAGRMIGRRFDRSALPMSRRASKPVPQPGKRSVWTGGWQDLSKVVPRTVELDRLHDAGILDFINPSLEWYFKDRQHVAGFQSHQFSYVPNARKDRKPKSLDFNGATEPDAENLKLQTLDLIGLVVHDGPVAYVSNNLPRMDELRQAPLRELNPFESAGLRALKSGEDLFVREMPDGNVRMLGAVRALSQCINCHGGARGDLLGAFSYELSKQ